MMKWYGTELNHIGAEQLKIALKDYGIKYEPSECGGLIHFEIYCDERQRDVIDSIIDDISDGQYAMDEELLLMALGTDDDMTLEELLKYYKDLGTTKITKWRGKYIANYLLAI